MATVQNWSNSWASSTTPVMTPPTFDPSQFKDASSRNAWGSTVETKRPHQKQRRGAFSIENTLQKQDLFKTEICRSFRETGSCRYGSKCQFAHGEGELRPVLRHPKYKTELCRTFEELGECPYGNRCRFVHYQRPTTPAASLALGEAATSKKGSRLPFFQKLHRSRSGDSGEAKKK